MSEKENEDDSRSAEGSAEGSEPMVDEESETVDEGSEPMSEGEEEGSSGVFQIVVAAVIAVVFVAVITRKRENLTTEEDAALDRHGLKTLAPWSERHAEHDLRYYAEAEMKWLALASQAWRRGMHTMSKHIESHHEKPWYHEAESAMIIALTDAMNAADPTDTLNKGPDDVNDHPRNPHAADLNDHPNAWRSARTIHQDRSAMGSNTTMIPPPTTPFTAHQVPSESQVLQNIEIGEPQGEGIRIPPNSIIGPDAHLDPPSLPSLHDQELQDQEQAARNVVRFGPPREEFDAPETLTDHFYY